MPTLPPLKQLFSLEYWPVLAATLVLVLAIRVGIQAGLTWTGFTSFFAVVLAGSALIWWKISGFNLYSAASGFGSTICVVASVCTSPLFAGHLQDGIRQVNWDLASSTASTIPPNQIPLGDYQRFQDLQKLAFHDCTLAPSFEGMHFVMAVAGAIYVDPLLGAFLPSPNVDAHLSQQCAQEYVQARTIAPWVFYNVTAAQQEALERLAKVPQVLPAPK